MTDFLYDIANSDPSKAIGGLGLFSCMAASLVAISLLQAFSLASALPLGSMIAVGMTGLALWAWASRPATGRGLNAEVQ